MLYRAFRQHFLHLSFRIGNIDPASVFAFQLLFKQPFHAGASDDAGRRVSFSFVLLQVFCRYILHISDQMRRCLSQRILAYFNVRDLYARNPQKLFLTLLFPLDRFIRLKRNQPFDLIHLRNRLHRYKIIILYPSGRQLFFHFLRGDLQKPGNCLNRYFPVLQFSGNDADRGSSPRSCQHLSVPVQDLPPFRRCGSNPDFISRTQPRKDQRILPYKPVPVLSLQKKRLIGKADRACRCIKGSLIRDCFPLLIVCRHRHGHILHANSFVDRRIAFNKIFLTDVAGS